MSSRVASFASTSMLIAPYLLAPAAHAQLTYAESAQDGGESWITPVNATDAPDGAWAVSYVDDGTITSSLVCGFSGLEVPAGACVKEITVTVRAGAVTVLHPSLIVSLWDGSTESGWVTLPTTQAAPVDMLFGPDGWDYPLAWEDVPGLHVLIRAAAKWDSTVRIDSVGIEVTYALKCNPDYTGDGNADQDDVACLLNVVAGGTDPCTGLDADFNGDGNVDQGDVVALIDTIASGECP